MFNKTRDLLNLSFQLAVANFKAKNEGSYLGIFWYLLEPLAFFTVLLFLGGAIYNNSILDYPAYLLIGLIIFNFFGSTTNNSSEVINRNRHFIRSIKIDLKAFVLADIFQSIFSHFFEVVLFIVLLIYLKINLFFMIFYPLIFISLCLFTAGISFLFATIGVYVVDWKNIWQVGSRLLWFVTPVFYVVKDTNSLIAKINYINPLSHFITIARNLVIYGQTPTFFSIIGIMAISLITFFLGFFIFEKASPYFAEKI